MAAPLNAATAAVQQLATLDYKPRRRSHHEKN